MTTGLLMLSIMSPLLAKEGNNWDALMGVLSSAISSSTISGVLVSVGTVAIAIVFFWWAVRKVSQVIFSAFRSGKFRV